MYVLPATNLTSREGVAPADGAHHDFQWLAKEIVQEGGEATVCRASLVDGLTNAQVEALFQRARETDYRQLADEARAALKRPGKMSKAELERTRLGMEAELTRLRKRFAEVKDIDFFEAPGRQAVEAGLAALDQAITVRGPERPTPPGEAQVRLADFQKRVWVTRANVHVDRIASAWLIKRFIDSEATFRFAVSNDAVKSKLGSRREVTFDVTDGDFTHVGDRCSFETLVHRFSLRDPGIEAIAEVVHDLDVKDGKFGRVEAEGIGALLAGTTLLHPEDTERVAAGTLALDALYAHFRRRRP